MIAEHEVRIYYEDTDLSGLVYHANYLEYFERAREHLLGPEELARLWDEDGGGFVVYKCELTFREGARLGQVLQVRTTVTSESRFRLIFQQDVYREGRDTPMVQGRVELVTTDRDGKLVRLPEQVAERLGV